MCRHTSWTGGERRTHPMLALLHRIRHHKFPRPAGREPSSDLRGRGFMWPRSAGREELPPAAGSRLTPAHPVSSARAERRDSSTHGVAGVLLHSPRTSEGQHSRSPSIGTEPTPPGPTKGLPPGRSLGNGSGRGPAQAAPPPLPRPSSRSCHDLRARTCPPRKAQTA